MIQINIKIDSGKGFGVEFDEEPLLRDLFAAFALAGFNAAHGHDPNTDGARCFYAYEQADKMMKIRKR